LPPKSPVTETAAKQPPPPVQKARPKPMPRKVATRKTTNPNRKKSANILSRDSALVPHGSLPPVKDNDERGNEGRLAPDLVKSLRLMPKEPKKQQPDEAADEEKDKNLLDRTKNEAASNDKKGEVPPGKDPAADEEGFIPLAEALRRTSGSATAPSIVPNWISSNLSQDGEVGLDEYRREILALIDRNKVFPKGWNPLSRQGMAQVAGEVDGMTGQLMKAWVSGSSGYRELDRAALQTIRKCDPFPSIGSMGVLYFQVGIRYGNPEQASR
jgi:TonB family protein